MITSREYYVPFHLYQLASSSVFVGSDRLQQKGCGESRWSRDNVSRGLLSWRWKRRIPRKLGEKEVEGVITLLQGVKNLLR